MTDGELSRPSRRSGRFDFAQGPESVERLVPKTLGCERAQTDNATGRLMPRAKVAKHAKNSAPLGPWREASPISPITTDYKARPRSTARIGSLNSIGSHKGSNREGRDDHRRQQQ